MDELKAKYQEQQPAVRYALAAGAVVVGLVMVLKILPALLAAMGIGLLIAIFFVPYWLPTLIAFKRSHPSKGGVLAVNFFFGWTFIGWVLSLVWALSDNGSRSATTVVVNNTVQTHVGTQAAPPAPTYQVGDVVNGHQFTGTAWVPVPAGAAQALPPAAAVQLPQQAQPAPAIEPRQV